VDVAVAVSIRAGAAVGVDVAAGVVEQKVAASVAHAAKREDAGAAVDVAAGVVEQKVAAAVAHAA
jgi:hypothetical protein